MDREKKQKKRERERERERERNRGFTSTQGANSHKDAARRRGQSKGSTPILLNWKKEEEKEPSNHPSTPDADDLTETGDEM